MSYRDADAKHWHDHYKRLQEMFNNYRVMLIEELDIPEHLQNDLCVFGGVKTVRKIIQSLREHSK